MHPVTWLAHYNDGRTIGQFQGVTELSLRKLERDKISAISLVRPSGEPVLTMERATGEPFFYRRRTRIITGSDRQVCHLVGKQKVIDGEPIWLVMGFLEATGELLQSKGFRPGSWLEAPEFYPEELTELREPAIS